MKIGDTPAFPTTIEIGWAVVPKLPETPLYKRVFPSESGEILRQETTAASSIDLRIEVLETDFAATQTGEVHLWFYAAFHYNDFMDNPHEARFCWRWERPDNFARHQFVRAGDAPARYTAKT